MCDRFHFFLSYKVRSDKSHIERKVFVKKINLNILPLNTLILLALTLIELIVLFFITLELITFAPLLLLPLAPVLVCEIVGIIIREKLHKCYADNIAVLIANVICIPILTVFIVVDMNSTGFLAGLGGYLALMFWMPVYGVSLIINLIFFLVKRKKAEAAAQPSAEE